MKTRFTKPLHTIKEAGKVTIVRSSKKQIVAVYDIETDHLYLKELVTLGESLSLLKIARKAAAVSEPFSDSKVDELERKIRSSEKSINISLSALAVLVSLWIVMTVVFLKCN